MTRPGRAAKRLRKLLDLDLGLRPGRVEFVDRRQPADIDPCAATGPQIGLPVTRIALEIHWIVELRRIHEDRNHHAVGSTTRLFDQREMAGMQRTHGGHQGNSATGRSLGVGPGLELGSRGDDPHGSFAVGSSTGYR